MKAAEDLCKPDFHLMMNDADILKYEQSNCDVIGKNYIQTDISVKVRDMLLFRNI